MGNSYQVIQAGQVVSSHARKAEALAEAERLNREAEEELGDELVGDGAASVYDLARGEWVRT